MSTSLEQSHAPDTVQTKSVPPATATVTWEIQTADSQSLGQLSEATIVQGLREGWLGLDDLARKGETDWQPIRLTLGKSVFDIKAFINSPRAHAEQGAGYGAIALAIISALGTLINFSITMLHLDIGRMIVFLIVMLVATVVLFRVKSCVAGILTLVVAVAVLNAIRIRLNVSAVAGIAIGTVLSCVIGGMIGGGVGFVIGWMVGILRRERYRLPETRQPAPEWVVSPQLSIEG